MKYSNTRVCNRDRGTDRKKDGVRQQELAELQTSQGKNIYKGIRSRAAASGKQSREE